MRNLYLLGATGSIGTQALNIIRKNQDYRVLGISFYNNISLGKEIIKEFKPELVWVKNEEIKRDLEKEFPKVKIYFGKEGMIDFASYKKPGLVLNALTGSSGLLPTYYAIKSKKDILLANKESLVIGGKLIIDLARKMKVSIFPLDSEHNSIYQLLRKENKEDVKKVYLTASGGALRDKNREELKSVTKAEVLNHPNWKMGDKITVDSATLINKGFEVIEAYHLFGLELNQIDTVLHRESIVHALVEYKDSTVLANLSYPNMEIPISYALSYPKRRKTSVASLDLGKLKSLNFEKIDYERYPLLKLSFEVLEKGEAKQIAYSASNEAAVNLFLDGKISFLEIEQIVIEAVKKDYPKFEISLDNILDLDLEIKKEIYEKYK